MRAKEFIKENDVDERPIKQEEEIIDLYVNYESDSFKFVEHAWNTGKIVDMSGLSKEEFIQQLLPRNKRKNGK